MRRRRLIATPASVPTASALFAAAAVVAAGAVAADGAGAARETVPAPAGNATTRFSTPVTEADAGGGVGGTGDGAVATASASSASASAVWPAWRWARAGGGLRSGEGEAPTGPTAEYLRHVATMVTGECTGAGCCNAANGTDWVFRRSQDAPVWPPERSGPFAPGVYDDGTGKPVVCDAGHFCPEGYACRMACLDGASCVPGKTEGVSDPTSPSAVCPAGFYCPTRADPVPCPRGHFCRAGAQRPRPCSMLMDCPAGSTDNQPDYPAELIICFVGILILGLLGWLQRHRTLRSRKLEYGKPRRSASVAEAQRELLVRKQSVMNMVAIASDPTTTDAPAPSVVPPEATVNGDAPHVRVTAEEPPLRRGIMWRLGGGASELSLDGHDASSVEGSPRGSPHRSPRGHHRRRSSGAFGAWRVGSPLRRHHSSSEDAAPLLGPGDAGASGGHRNEDERVGLNLSTSKVPTSASRDRGPDPDAFPRVVFDDAAVGGGGGSGGGGGGVGEDDGGSHAEGGGGGDGGNGTGNGGGGNGVHTGNADESVEIDTFADAAPVRAPRRIEVTFVNVGLRLRENGETIISGITGRFSPGTMSAIIGPSGSGKTSLLNVILGRAHYGVVTGTVLANGSPAAMRTLRSEIGLVPQEDVMHTELTVNEVLTYQARLRLPPWWSRRQIRRLVADTVATLDIASIAGSRIGDIKRRGISGGQRKRVNIGMELVADPTVLVLDEPTSGLDSTSGLRVVASLQQAARERQLTVVTVLHQPRFEIFQCFDRLLLLSAGGRLAFEGCTRAPVAYFERLGYRLPPKMNPADFLLDVVSGVIPNTGGGPAFEDLPDAWAKHREQRYGMAAVYEDECGVPHAPRLSVQEEADDRGAVFQPFRSASGGSVNSAAAAGDDDDDLDPDVASKPRPTRGFFTHFAVLCQRELLLYGRTVVNLMTDFFLVVLGATVLGYTHLTATEAGDAYNVYTLSSMVVGITSAISSIGTFGARRHVYFREATSGLHRPAFFAAVCAVHVPFLLINATAYQVTFYFIVVPNAPFWHQWYVVLCTVYACSGLGYVITFMFSAGSRQMAAAVIVLVSCMLDGGKPTRTSGTLDNPGGEFLLAASYARWMSEAMWQMEIASSPQCLWRSFIGLVHYYGVFPDPHPFGWACSALLAYGTVARAVAYLLMVGVNRGKQR